MGVTDNLAGYYMKADILFKHSIGEKKKKKKMVNAPEFKIHEIFVERFAGIQ